jgi:serine/threonine-protein kinase
MKRAFVGTAFAFALLAARPAPAQTKDDIARADALFNAGKALTDAGQFQDACAKFAEAKRLAPGIGVTLYLADCYEHIGRTASAWTEFRSAEGQARERNDKRADVARAHAQALEPKLNRVTITVAPTVPLAGLQVLRDGQPVEQEELGLPVPVDPGEHAIVVSSPHHSPRTFTARVGPEKPAATIVIDALGESTGAAPTPPPSPPPAPAPVPATTALTTTPEAQGEAPADEDPGKTRRWLGIGVGGLGVVAAGVGAVFGLIAKSKLDQSNSDGNCNASDQCTTTGLGLRKDAQDAASTSTLLFIGGGVALAAGVVLFVTAPRRSPATGIVVAPAPMIGGGGALVRAVF